MGRKKIIYICSPVTGDIENNIKKAEGYSRIVYNRGYLPLCVHIYLERATGLSEANGNREELLELGRDYLKICDEIWVFGDRISEGMKGEIELATKLGKRILYMKSLQ